MKDFIIVGRGLAAHVLMHQLHFHQLTFTVVGKKELSSSSRVAAGIWNPIVFKRLTKSWMADDLIPALNKFYADCERQLNKKFTQQLNILKPFAELQEEELWIKKSKNELDDYLDPKIYPTEKAPKGAGITTNFGLVKNCGNLNVSAFLDAGDRFFKESIINETFKHEQLKVQENEITYGDTKARAIIFCEGWLIKNNPFFNWAPLKPAKGEILTLEIPELHLGNTIINRGHFLMPDGMGSFKCGATYDWENLDENTSEQAKNILLQKLVLDAGLNIKALNHEAGIRPASIDRRPIIGPHPKFSNLFVFNGLGTKGVMLAPYFAINFVNFYLQKQNLIHEVDVKRFYHLYEAGKRN